MIHQRPQDWRPAPAETKGIESWLWGNYRFGPFTNGMYIYICMCAGAGVVRSGSKLGA